MPASWIRLIVWLVPVVGLLTYYSFRVAGRDDPRLYYEVAGQTLGRAYDAEYVQEKRGEAVTVAGSGAAVPVREEGLLITAKVLSPQYLLWLFPVALALPDRRIGVMFLAAVVLTHVYYPGNRFLDYQAVMHMTWAGVVVLLGRNGMLVVMVVLAFRAVRGWVCRGHMVAWVSAPPVVPHSAG